MGHEWYKQPPGSVETSYAEGVVRCQNGQNVLSPLDLPHMSPGTEVFSIHSARPGAHLLSSRSDADNVERSCIRETAVPSKRMHSPARQVIVEVDVVSTVDDAALSGETER